MHDDLRARSASNCASAYRYWAESMGKRAEVWDDLSVGDLGMPVTLPVNNATLLRPNSAMDDVVERVRDFFAASPGGGWEMWCLWPTPDLASRGLEAFDAPCMMREPGGERPPVPDGLQIVEATDAASVRQAEVLLDEVYGCRTPEAGALLRPSMIRDDFRVWVGLADGRPVSTAAACVAAGFVGIYAVATDAHARGRGYGEALTWSATLSRPELPATLQASAMGRPIYERMGFRTVGRFTVWFSEQR